MGKCSKVTASRDLACLEAHSVLQKRPGAAGAPVMRCGCPKESKSERKKKYWLDSISGRQVLEAKSSERKSTESTTSRFPLALSSRKHDPDRSQKYGECP